MFRRHNMTKICYTCKIEKPIIDFHKKKKSKDGYHPTCKLCRKSESIVYYKNNKTKIIEKSKKYGINNIDKVRLYKKRYKLKHKSKINTYNRLRNYNDSDYRFRRILRLRIWHALKGNNKSKSTMELLGCSIDELKIHLQKTAINNNYIDFNIEN